MGQGVIGLLTKPLTKVDTNNAVIISHSVDGKGPAIRDLHFGVVEIGACSHVFVGHGAVAFKALDGDAVDKVAVVEDGLQCRGCRRHARKTW